MRLLDRIIREGLDAVPSWTTQQEGAVIRHLPSAKLVVADNVATMVYENEREVWTPPSMTPPFPVMWIEWLRPRYFRSQVAGERPIADMVPAETGVLIFTIDVRKPKPPWMPLDYLGMAYASLCNPVGGMGGLPTPPGEVDVAGCLSPEKEAQVRWLVVMAMFMRDDDPSGSGPLLTIGPAVSRAFALDDNGFRIADKAFLGGGKYILEKWGEDAAQETLSSCKLAVPAMVALGLMHCKNVKIVETSPPLPRAARRRGDAPFLSYRTIHVRPTGHRGESVERGLSGELPMHVCRGHFKVFGPEKPLLGKHVGTYWWEAHARGSTEKGTVQSSYEIDPPDKATD